MQNQRRSDRRRMFYYLEVEDAESGSPMGRLGDISLDGLMLLTRESLPLEKRYSLSIHLPKGSSFPQGRLDLQVETRWIRRDQNPEILCVGCRFLESGLDQRETFASLIDYYGFSDGYKQFRQTKAV